MIKLNYSLDDLPSCAIVYIELRFRTTSIQRSKTKTSQSEFTFADKKDVNVRVHSLISNLKTYHTPFHVLPPGHRSFVCRFNSTTSKQLYYII